jgi:hypothetical protein
MRSPFPILVIGLLLAGTAVAQPPVRFHAQLSGGDANGNVIDTVATGQASFEVIDGGTAIRYRVNLAGIENLWMAHIHVSEEPGGNGPIAFWFVPTTGGPPPDTNVQETVQGVLDAGYILTNAQIGGPLASTGIAGMIQAMEEGRAYVVIHTNDLDPNTPSGGAGDSPPGELRGQIE